MAGDSRVKVWLKKNIECV